MDLPPPAPDRTEVPTSAWVSLAAAAVSVAFLWVPTVLSVFGLAAAGTAMVAGLQDRDPWQARVGFGLGIVMAVLILIGLTTR